MFLFEKAYAQGIFRPELSEKVQNGTLTLNDFPLVILGLIDLITRLVGTVAVIMLIYAGFQLILSDLVSSKEDAKTTIRYALTGLAVAFSAYIIVDALQRLLTQ